MVWIFGVLRGFGLCDDDCRGGLLYWFGVGFVGLVCVFVLLLYRGCFLLRFGLWCLGGCCCLGRLLLAFV